MIKNNLHLPLERERERERERVTLVVKGNLISEGKLSGNIISGYDEELDTQYDISCAIIIDGDVHVNAFDSSHSIVLVTGCVATKGGDYGV